MKLKRRHLALAIAAVFLLTLSLLWLSALIQQRRQPVYEDKRIGAWFNASSAGIEPPDVFGRFDSNAVPFLVQKLRRSPSPATEALITRGRRNPIAHFLFDFVEPPSLTRTHAALALQHMGVKAESALPELLAALKEEPHPSVAHYFLMALGTISGYEFPPEQIHPDATAVLRHVRSRYPHLFPAPLVPLGTNALAPGTILYNPHTTQYWAKVLEVDRAYEFPDDTIRPGVLIETKNGSEWVPREGLKKVLVPDRLDSAR